MNIVSSLKTVNADLRFLASQYRKKWNPARQDPQLEILALVLSRRSMKNPCRLTGEP
jgi:hypothetical protein